MGTATVVNQGREPSSLGNHKQEKEQRSNVQYYAFNEHGPLKEQGNGDGHPGEKNCAYDILGPGYAFIYNYIAYAAYRCGKNHKYREQGPLQTVCLYSCLALLSG